MPSPDNLRSMMNFRTSLALADFASLFDAILDVTSADPVALSEYCVPLPPLPCTKPGTYSIDLLHAGELLGSWRLVAVAIEAQGLILTAFNTDLCAPTRGGQWT